ncbi:tensin-1 isoform X6 [Osmia bicornis bicornis]|uniref:tensin-1 isoform X6 n=1 Tax=Osmia bicornis bicornis TaxID=1437191 RepID=UPI0010F66B83|nr:tensin-1 isoform X6 [Osmia bicornis bicornis]XP_029051302.1 tensin-1 isoform X6 [Osmia bicornis bicornis]XP_029051303.1 tensin-1 isoform X6 [Osmia bicornis bicornis]XP_046144655.1 tensin-1 isoform X6 [Osmia bicornis bicornis]
MKAKISRKELDDLFGEGARFRDTSQQIHKQWQADPARAFPTVGTVTTGSVSPTSGDISSPNSTPSPSPSPTNSQQVTHNGGYEVQPKNINTISRSKQHQIQTSSSATTPARTPGVGADATTTGSGKGGGRVTEVMELCYVTERIIALWYREDAQGVLEHATALLRGKHADNYMIFNLSSPGRPGEPNTREAGWPQGLAPSLERLCALCKELDSWLNGAPNRVVVLHARGSKERLGVAVSAYMNYSSICGGRDQALDRFAMRRFLDDKIGSLQVPSHRRYIKYFSGLLSGSLRISQSPLYLTHLTVLGVPLFEPTGCRAFLKVYEGLTPVYTSDLYSVTNAREFTVNLGGLRLRGDILVKCYHRVYSKQSREVMFSLQFHTCVISENVVSFPRSELDVACDDPRCPPDSVVTLYFASDAKRQDGPIPAPTPAVPHASAHHDPILHWDSYTNLEISDDEGRETPLSPPPPSSSSVQTSPRGLGYTCGPIDGSLYAVVHQGAAGGARGSPLTVSMDSGISSAPPQRPSPPEPEPDNQAHGDLDKLLHDMMLTVESMPDPPSEEYRRERNEKMYIQESRGYSSHTSSHSPSTYSTLKDSYRSYSAGKESSPPYNSSSSYSTLKNEYREPNKIEHRREEFDYRVSPDRKISESSTDSYRKHTDSFSPPGNIDYIDEDIPYHARQTSQPFSYGATSDMIKHQKLSSPSLVRKASVRGTAPMVDFEDILGENSRRPISPLSPNTPDPPPEFANGPTKGNSDHVDGLSWLRQQQLKLAARRDERNPGKLWRQETGNRVIGELRSLQRNRLRHDGYASDSAVLDDDDDAWVDNPTSGQTQTRPAPYTSAPASPLLPQRSSSRKYNGTAGTGTLGRPRAESVNERPFMSVKRAYEYRKYSDSQSPPTSPRSGLASTQPLGLAMQQQATFVSTDKPQPPRPESRSDSFIRADALLREHRQQQQQLATGNSIGNHTDQKQDFARGSRPESRNRVIAYQSYDRTTMTSNDRSVDHVDAGLLAVVDQQSTGQNNADPLVSLIQSLAEISPVRSPSSVTNKTVNDHHSPSNSAATAATASNNVANTITNCSPNQSPKAWQNCTQSHNDSASSWTERSVSPGSAVVSNASRPQTPAFPVHPRTPYVNNSSPTVTFAADRAYSTSNTSYNVNNNNNNVNNVETAGNNNNNVGNYASERTIYIEERREVSKETGLPPKSPTTQRRLSFPASGPLKQTHNKRWPLTNQSASFDYSKDRSVSPINESTMQSQVVSRSPGTPTHIEFSQSPKSATSYTSINSGGQSSPQVQYYGSRRSSVHSNTEPQEVADANVKFVRDTSRIWYKPNISREQAISMLKDAAPGTFVVRDSNSFPGAFGLALKVATPPPGAPSSPRDPSSELVRHFLIEPTSRGVRLKGCANEPVFSSLSALVYQHSLMAMALPCQLLLPEPEAAARALDSSTTNSTQQLLAQGAACNVLYLFTMDTESLTGPQAIKKAVTTMFEQKPLPTATIVHFKVSTQGITLTDNARKLFFRRHYPTNNISYCGLDTEERTWDFTGDDSGRSASAHRCFGFVARKPAHKSDNQCHVFAELEPEQPATAIVNFVNKVMMGNSIAKANIV